MDNPKTIKLVVNNNHESSDCARLRTICAQVDRMDDPVIKGLFELAYRDALLAVALRDP